MKNRSVKFAIVCSVITLADFLIYTFLARVINNNDLLWFDSLIAYLLTTFLAYFMHSRITWQEHRPDAIGVVKFFLWNFFTALVVVPLFTRLFELFTPFYTFIFNLATNLGLSFDFNFIESTMVFIFTLCATLIINFFFYDRLVFGKPVQTPPAPLTTFTDQKVSIIVPIYNTSKYLTKCLDSIINQSYRNLEIILIDDGSTDNSGQIADDYAHQDSRIKVIHQKNQGQSAARNRGLKLATGDFISFIDSDDKIDKNFISKLLAPYEDDDTAVAVCGRHDEMLRQKCSKTIYISYIRPQKKHESKKAYILYLLATDGRIYSVIDKVFRSNIAKKIKFNESINFSEDTNYVLDYLNKAGGKIRFVLEPLYTYNYGTESSTIRKSSTIWKNWQAAYINLKRWLGPHINIRERFWLYAVRLRWCISFIRAKHRAAKD